MKEIVCIVSTFFFPSADEKFNTIHVCTLNAVLAIWKRGTKLAQLCPNPTESTYQHL